MITSSSEVQRCVGCGQLVRHVQHTSYASSGFKSYYLQPVAHRRPDGQQCLAPTASPK